MVTPIRPAMGGGRGGGGGVSYLLASLSCLTRVSSVVDRSERPVLVGREEETDGEDRRWSKTRSEKAQNQESRPVLCFLVEREVEQR